jgi:hypothetical protein
MIFAIFKGKHSLFVRASALILGIPSIIFSGLTGFDDSDFVVTGIVFSTVLFFAVCVVSILKDVLLEARVTLETLRGIVCVYFLFAFLFAYIFLFIELMNPGSLLIRGEILPVLPNVTSYFCEMLYFSFVTLLTIGFGDIVAAKNLSQTAAVIEGIVGQLYIVMLMGRFISVYSFRSNGKSG